METLSKNYYQLSSKHRQLQTITNDLEVLTEKLTANVTITSEQEINPEFEHESIVENEPTIELPSADEQLEADDIIDLTSNVQSLIEREPSPPRKRRKRAHRKRVSRDIRSVSNS